MLVDTDVIIWYLRNEKKAVGFVDGLGPFAISAVTYIEILQGIRDKHELKAWKAFIKDRNIQVLTIDQDVTSKAMYWMEEYVLSHGLRLADALIAATADVHGKDLVTGNISDYRFIHGISLKHFRI